MTIEEAKVRNELLEGLLATTLEIIHPYMINEKQFDVFVNSCHEIVSIANNEIEYSINMDRISKAMNWDEYNRYFKEKNYNQLAPQQQS